MRIVPLIILIISAITLADPVNPNDWKTYDLNISNNIGAIAQDDAGNYWISYRAKYITLFQLTVDPYQGYYGEPVESISFSFNNPFPEAKKYVLVENSSGFDLNEVTPDNKYYLSRLNQEYEIRIANNTFVYNVYDYDEVLLNEVMPRSMKYYATDFGLKISSGLFLPDTLQKSVRISQVKACAEGTFAYMSSEKVFSSRAPDRPHTGYTVDTINVSKPENITVDANGTVWIISQGPTISKFENKQLTHVHAFNDPNISKTLPGIELDEKGYLWGSGVISGSEKYYLWTYNIEHKHYKSWAYEDFLHQKGIHEGLKFMQKPASLFVNNFGEIVIGGYNSMMIYQYPPIPPTSIQMKNIHPTKMIPNSNLNAYNVHGRKIPQQTTGQIPPGVQVLGNKLKPSVR